MDTTITRLFILGVNINSQCAVRLQRIIFPISRLGYANDLWTENKKDKTTRPAGKKRHDIRKWHGFCAQPHFRATFSESMNDATISHSRRGCLSKNSFLFPPSRVVLFFLFPDQRSLEYPIRLRLSAGQPRGVLQHPCQQSFGTCVPSKWTVRYGQVAWSPSRLGSR